MLDKLRQLFGMQDQPLPERQQPQELIQPGFGRGPIHQKDLLPRPKQEYRPIPRDFSQEGDLWSGSNMDQPIGNYHFSLFKPVPMAKDFPKRSEIPENVRSKKLLFNMRHRDL